MSVVQPEKDDSRIAAGKRPVGMASEEPSLPGYPGSTTVNYARRILDRLAYCCVSGDCPERFGKIVAVVLAEFRDGLYLRGRRFDEASIQVLVENRNHERVPELSILTCFFTVSLLFLIVAELH